MCGHAGATVQRLYSCTPDGFELKANGVACDAAAPTLPNLPPRGMSASACPTAPALACQPWHAQSHYRESVWPVATAPIILQILQTPWETAMSPSDVLGNAGVRLKIQLGTARAILPTVYATRAVTAAASGNH